MGGGKDIQCSSHRDAERAYFFDGAVELTFLGDETEPSEARVLGSASEGQKVSVGLYHAMRILMESVLAEGASSYAALAVR